MIKKDIQVTDLDGNPKVKTYYFSIPPAEMFRMDAEMGGLEKALTGIIAEKQTVKVVEILEDLMRKSVGIRKDDEFYRSDEVTETFMASEACSAMLVEFLTNPAACAEWCAGILPADLQKKLKESGALELPEAAKPRVFPTDYSREELVAMSKAEFEAGLATLPGSNIPKELLIIGMSKK